MIKLDQVSKIYNSDAGSAIGIQNVSLEFKMGEFVAITGESGSGKSTLLNVVSLLDTYEEGEVFVNGKSTIEFSKEDFANYSANYVSFVFQEYNLIDSYTVLFNVMLPLIARGVSKKEAKDRAIEAIKKVGLSNVMHSKSAKLSGGEKQRVVIARSLVSDTPIIACDEPTGNLDSKSAEMIVNIFKEISKDRLILYVTHDYDSIKDVATRHISMKDGHVKEDVVLSNPHPVTKTEVNQAHKTKFSSLIGLAMKNFISLPKQAIFSFLVALVLSFVTVYEFSGIYGAVSLIGEEVKSMNDTDNTYIDTVISPNHVVVSSNKKSDHTPASELIGSEDYFYDPVNMISNVHSFNTTIDTYVGTLQNMIFTNGGVISDEMELIAGVAPSEPNEIALAFTTKDWTSDFIFYNKDNYVKYIVDSSITVSYSYYSWFDAKITGIYYYPFMYSNWAPKIVFSQQSAKMFSAAYEEAIYYGEEDGVISTNCHLYGVTGNGSLGLMPTLNGIDVSVLNALEITHDYFIISEAYKGFDLRFDYYDQYLKTLYYVDVPAEKIIYHNLDGFNYVSSYAYYSLMKENEFLFSVYSNNAEQAKSLEQKFVEHGYDCIKSDTPTRSVKYNNTASIVLLIVVSLIGVIWNLAICVVMSIFAAMILSAISKNKKRDYAILSTLSFSTGDTYVINGIETTISMVLGSLVAYGAALLIFNLFKNTEIAGLTNSIIATLTSWQVVFYFLFILLLSIYLSYRVIKRLFKKSRATAIRRDDSLL